MWPKSCKRTQHGWPATPNIAVKGGYIHQPTAWPVPHVCAQPYHLDSSNNEQLFRLHWDWGSSAWHSRQVKLQLHTTDMWELLAGSCTAVLSRHGCYMLLPFAPRVYSLLVCTPCCICVLLRVIAQSFKTVKLLATPRLACLASVSNRVIARKLERKRKIKRCKREGEGRRGSFFPLPRHSFFFFALVLARKRLLRRLLRGCS